MGLDIQTRTRVEHLPETEKHKHKSINPLQDFLGATQDHASSANPAIEAPPTNVVPAQTIPLHSMEEYFTEPQDKDEYDGKESDTLYVCLCTTCVSLPLLFHTVTPLSLHNMPIASAHQIF